MQPVIYMHQANLNLCVKATLLLTRPNFLIKLQENLILTFIDNQNFAVFSTFKGPF